MMNVERNDTYLCANVLVQRLQDCTSVLIYFFFFNYKSECILSQRVDMGQVSCGVEYTQRRSALKGTGRRLRSIFFLFFDVLKTLSSFKTVSCF